MNSRVLGLRVASALFGLMCVGQLIRLIMQLGIQVGSHPVPLWFSGVAALVLAGLSLWLWRLGMEPPKSAVPPAA
ncbi:hypothetical protein [Opitutus terrae]|uniref:Uncharacterized protein n=1 Tax=Opitutus terrae (strain DSM 11246 / JCM 15787 / PB90-1) TaxID=452637 RepID=B1ZQR2_OPITP|nr:hypothetical protein [Opitutus terrae]ACB77813.1 hypothetical protein Oter_4542 [Opitutus terrae PB90-1]